MFAYVVICGVVEWTERERDERIELQNALGLCLIVFTYMPYKWFDLYGEMITVYVVV